MSRIAFYKVKIRNNFFCQTKVQSETFCQTFISSCKLKVTSKVNVLEVDFSFEHKLMIR